jgi:hypothetical protein
MNIAKTHFRLIPRKKLFCKKNKKMMALLTTRVNKPGSPYSQTLVIKLWPRSFIFKLMVERVTILNSGVAII